MLLVAGTIILITLVLSQLAVNKSILPNGSDDVIEEVMSNFTNDFDDFHYTLYEPYADTPEYIEGTIVVSSPYLNPCKGYYVIRYDNSTMYIECGDVSKAGRYELAPDYGFSFVQFGNQTVQFFSIVD